MCDYSNDDLKQLLSVFSEEEYLNLSIQKTHQMHDEISVLMKTVKNNNLLFFLSLFKKVLLKEQDQYKEHLKENPSEKSFEFPKIFNFDSVENDEQNLANFVTQYDLYINVSNIMVESYKSCDSFREDIIKIHEMASESTIIDRLNNLEINDSDPVPVQEEPVPVERVTDEPPAPVHEEPPAPVHAEPPAPVHEESKVVDDSIPTVDVSEQNEPLSQENNADKKEFKYSLEIYKHMTDSTPPVMSVDEVKDVLLNKLEEFKSICNVLQSKKNEIQECKTSLEEFKKKGMNVDSAILPLDEQHNEIDTQWKLNVNSLVEMKDKVVELVDAMNKDVNKYRPEPEPEPESVTDEPAPEPVTEPVTETVN